MDVTERKRSEAELSESEELFRNIFHHHAAVKLLLDAKKQEILLMPTTRPPVFTGGLEKNS